jgi:DNA-directed RNA polymerase specialized sigma24 family protein
VSDIETLTADECAAAWGVKTATFLGYVSRGQAPAALPDRLAGRRVWDADEVRRFPRPGPGRSRIGAGTDAEALLAEMRDVAERIEELRTRQRALLAAGKERGLEIAPMAKALGISRQTAYSWLGA